MSTGTTLYYPFIHPRDLNCLKSSLLYWDRIRRIVPDSLRLGDHVLYDDDDGRLLTDRELLIQHLPKQAPRLARLADAEAAKVLDRLPPVDIHH